MKGALPIEADINVEQINNILFRKYEPGWQYRFTRRPTCALYYILSGELRATLPAGELCLTAGEVYAFDADIPLLLENRGTVPLESYQISFYADRNLSDLGIPVANRGAADLRGRFAAA